MHKLKIVAMFQSNLSSGDACRSDAMCPQVMSKLPTLLASSISVCTLPDFGLTTVMVSVSSVTGYWILLVCQVLIFISILNVFNNFTSKKRIIITCEANQPRICGINDVFYGLLNYLQMV
uniref:Uncharacterized protein n=1 Tax=Glossina palpalis gambiensis TaxID=67801 RepID=A0A1B0BRG6_9MUSC